MHCGGDKFISPAGEDLGVVTGAGAEVTGNVVEDGPGANTDGTFSL